jgi:serine/threonine protein kinase
MSIALATASAAEAAEMPPWLGGYRVLERIAEGGMGRLYRALDTVNCRMVALKTPRANTLAESASLLREAATLRRLDHPGIVRLYADGTWDGVPWMALELLEGRTLLAEMDAQWEGADRARSGESRRRRSRETPTVPGWGAAPAPGTASPARSGGALPKAAAGRLEGVARIVLQLGTILDHLHGRGLVHRDVKPANVFLRHGGRVTLLDFGLVCRARIARPAGASSLCVGTMQYAAPEQIVGAAVDARADVYSMGCILYELVTGARPFDGDSSHELAQKHLYREAPAPSTLVTGLPWQVEDLILGMLAKTPDDRPSSAGAAARLLATAVQPG